MPRTYPRCRQNLIRFGHAEFDADRIIRDASRGNKFSIRWILMTKRAPKSRLRVK